MRKNWRTRQKKKEERVPEEGLEKKEERREEREAREGKRRKKRPKTVPFASGTHKEVCHSGYSASLFFFFSFLCAENEHGDLLVQGSSQKNALE